MNETSILSRDSYGLVNQLSDWGCFDSKLSASSPVFSKYLTLIFPSNLLISLIVLISFVSSNVATEKRSLLGGLSCTKEVWLLNK